MGFFDKLKDAANFVTGGSAKVTVQAVDRYNDGAKAIPFKIRINVKDKDIHINKIYLKIKSVEEVEVYDTQDNVTHSQTSIEFKGEKIIHKADTFSANQIIDMKAEFQLPENLSGTYEGTNARHRYFVKVGLDMKGNDPDSGWQVFYVYL